MLPRTAAGLNREFVGAFLKSECACEITWRPSSQCGLWFSRSEGKPEILCSQWHWCCWSTDYTLARKALGDPESAFSQGICSITSCPINHLFYPLSYHLPFFFLCSADHRKRFSLLKTNLPEEISREVNILLKSLCLGGRFHGLVIIASRMRLWLYWEHSKVGREKNNKALRSETTPFSVK